MDTLADQVRRKPCATGRRQGNQRNRRVVLAPNHILEDKVWSALDGVQRERLEWVARSRRTDDDGAAPVGAGAAPKPGMVPLTMTHPIAAIATMPAATPTGIALRTRDPVRLAGAATVATEAVRGGWGRRVRRRRDTGSLD